MAHYNDNSRPLASPTEEQVDQLASLYSSYHHDPYSQQQHAAPHDPYNHQQHNPNLSYPQYQTVSHQVQQSQHAQQPTYTPVQGNAILPSTHSPSYSSDIYAPFLSSTSDSGTSGPSTLSSRIPSPALHNVHDWSNHHFAMGLGVLDKDRYPSDRVYDMMDPDNLAELGKIASGVGESTDFSSFNGSLQSAQCTFPPSTSAFPSSLPTDAAWSWDPNWMSAATAFPPSQVTSPDPARPSAPFKAPNTPASVARLRASASPHMSSSPPQRPRRHPLSPLPTLLPRHPNVNRNTDHGAPQPFLSPSPHFHFHPSGAYVPPLASSYPALIEPQYSTPAPHQTQYATSQSPNPAYMYSVSPSLSHGSLPSHGSIPSSGAGPIRSEQKAPRTWQPYGTHRSQSVLSDHSHHSAASCASDDKKEVCPIDGCNREVRDLKAHLLTHQSQRPEKCPIASCPYHLKGFSRKYDKNRHTLTHFKGTMVCDFCTGAGTAHEKTFNRTDVFKRHLQAVHGVEQSATAARKKSASSTRSSTSTESMGLCRTCGRQFATAQALYDHIDDCALQSVQQEDPSEAINLANLSSVSDDPDVLRTLELLNLPTTLNGPVSFPDLSADFGSPPPAPDDQH